MNELVFLLSADADIQKAYDFYEDYQEGRGGVFMRRVQLGGAGFPALAPAATACLTLPLLRHHHSDVF